MFKYRLINIQKDREILLKLHCRINYESETPFARKMSYEQYRKKWLSTAQPDSFILQLKKTMKDKRTMAEILADENGAITGYLWVIFNDIQGYNITIAEVMDIIVTKSYQRHGVGLMMLKHIEEVARQRGATLLRSDTGIENIASQKLHKKFGFKPYRIQYEKVLLNDNT